MGVKNIGLFSLVGGGIGQKIARFITDSLIDKEIHKNYQKVRWYIDQWWRKACISMAITSVTNILIFVFALLFVLVAPYIIFSLMISVLSIFLLCRGVYAIIKFILWIDNNRKSVREYAPIVLKNIRSHGLHITAVIETSVHEIFERVYYKKTNPLLRFGHNSLASLGVIKSYDELECAVVQLVFRLYRYGLGIIFHKTVAFGFFIFIFVAILKPFMMSSALHMNFFEILLYPFTVLFL